MNAPDHKADVFDSCRNFACLSKEAELRDELSKFRSEFVRLTGEKLSLVQATIDMQRELEKLRQRCESLDAVLNASCSLVLQLDAVHEHPAYASVWMVSQMHVGPYKGPTYTAELERLRSLIDTAIGRAGGGES